MEPTLFAIAASKSLVEATRTLSQRADELSLEELRRAVVRTGMLYVNSVVDGFVLSFMRDGKARLATQMLLRNLSAIIKGVCRAAIHQAARQSGKGEFAAIRRFFEERVVTTVCDGQKVGLIVYPLSEAQKSRLVRAIEAGSNGHVREQRGLFVEALTGVLDESLARHFDDAFANLKLQGLARGAVKVGRRAIHGAGVTAVHLSVAQDGEEELRNLANVLKSHLLPASMCRPAQ